MVTETSANSNNVNDVPEEQSSPAQESAELCGTNCNATVRPESESATAAALCETPFWGVCPDKIVELPDADTFKAAIDKLRLPQIVCGEPFECVIKLFTYNNSFAKRIQLVAFSIVNQPDFMIEMNARRDAVHIMGTPRLDGTLKIRIEYKTATALMVRTAHNEIMKTLTILPDPLAVHNREFQKLLQSCHFSNPPAHGVAGEPFESRLDLSDSLSVFQGRIRLIRCDVTPQSELTAAIGENGLLVISGTPVTAGPLALNLHYTLSFSDGPREYAVKIPFTIIDPDPVLSKWEHFLLDCTHFTPRRAMAGENFSLELPLPDSFDPSCMEIADLETSAPQFRAEYDAENRQIRISGIPSEQGTVKLRIFCTLAAGSVGNAERNLEIPFLTVTPDPKTLWKNLPTDPDAPYQTKDEEHVILQAGERTVVAASKRGRSHAHDGKFRDDSFKAVYLEETGWFIIAVSDGAGSAKFSREGSRIACDAFCEMMVEKLSSAVVNGKISAMTPEERENALKNTVLSAAYRGLTRIDAEAKNAAGKNAGVTRRDYSATFLGYIMKRFENTWLIVSIGIGDGIVGLLDRDNELVLLSEPDGGEFAGQTRFITMNEVWQDNPIARTRAVHVNDFRIIMSMSDGVSDPKFETDNNLRNPQLWLELLDDLESQVPLPLRNEETAEKLSQWLDFWVKGNHDDRTLVLVY